MRTIEQYRAALSTYARWMWSIAAAVVVASVAAFVVPLTYSRRLPMAIGIVIFPVVNILGLLIVIWVYHIKLTQLSLRCLHCGKGLVGSFTKQVVIATRNCPHCGKPVLQGPEDTGDQVA